MDYIPVKVVALLGAGFGAFIGLGIMLYRATIVVRTATVKHQWQGFRSL